MKITLKDFGPISHFEFDLEKDLHVIFGKNNIGKSYAITAVYLILKNWMVGVNRSMNEIDRFLYDERNFDSIFDRRMNENVIKIENEIRNKIASGYDGDVSETIEPLWVSYMTNLFVKDIENSFKNSFLSIENLSNQYSSNKLQIELESENFNINLSVSGNSLILSKINFKSPITATVKDGDKEITYSYVYKGLGKDKGIVSCLSSLYYIFTSDVFLLIDKVYFLPSSRSGLYQALSTFSALLVELSKSRNFLTTKVDLPNISEPVSDYFLNLSNIKEESKIGFDFIIKYFENEILNGEILYNNENKKIFFRQTGMNVDLDLSFTSSMVSEIAPIVAHLKYIIGAGKRYNFSGNPNASYGLLFIEEPEAHLHPEVQVKLMEMFTMLAGKNVKMVMTSHSNYMFNKLSNLLLENRIDHNKVGSYLMRATDKGSVTDTLSMRAEADGMNDENFADVAEMLYEERIKIYDKLNKEAENVD